MENRPSLITLIGVFVLGGGIFLYLALLYSSNTKVQEVEIQVNDQFKSDMLQLIREALPPSLKPPNSDALNKPTVAADTLSRATPSMNWNEWLWTDAAHELLAADHLPEEGLAPFTREAQRYIYEHQHPRDCKSAKFVTDEGWNGGLGSDMHVAGARLGNAIAQGAIYIYTSDTDPEWTDDYLCPGNRGFQRCYFRPVTNCSAADIAPGRSQPGQDVSPDLPIPAPLVQMLQERYPAIKNDEVKYWWRAQSVTYLFRFNARTMEMLRSIRFDKNIHRLIPDEPWVREHFLAKPYMPAGVVSAHVRHGDKHIEMEIQPWEKYIDAAEQMLRNMPNSVTRFMFLSSDDPQVMEEANKYRPNGWAILYSDIPRLDRETISHMNSEVMVHQIGKGHEGNITLTHFSQLLMALEADAWLGTRGSNWNRLIDELRCTLVPKCKHVYVEVGTQEGYNWR